MKHLRIIAFLMVLTLLVSGCSSSTAEEPEESPAIEYRIIQIDENIYEVQFGELSESVLLISEFYPTYEMVEAIYQPTVDYSERSFPPSGEETISRSFGENYHNRIFEFIYPNAIIFMYTYRYSGEIRDSDKKIAKEILDQYH